MILTRHTVAAAVLGVLIVCPGASIRAQAPDIAPPSSLQARTQAAFRAAYELDHDTALAEARRAVADFPAEPQSHRTLASILWLQALFHRGAMTVDHYSGGLTSSSIDLPDPPAELAAAFHGALERAVALAEAKLDERPDDPDALYEAGAAYGLQASWIASVEGSVVKAFGAARRAFNAQERVLELVPDRIGAGTIVGIYRYAVAGLGFTSRMFAYLAGFGGGKEEGIALLEAAAGRGSESRFEASTALVLIYSREGRHPDAFRLLTAMAAEFPDNRVVVLERGLSAVRAGRAREAEQILLKGIAGLDDDKRQRMPGERALWFHRLGLARLALNRPVEAAGSLQVALESDPEPWIRGRIELALGKTDDLQGRRSSATERYRRARDIAQASKDPVAEREAGLLLRKPFVLSRSFTPLRPNLPTWHQPGAAVV